MMPQQLPLLALCLITAMLPVASRQKNDCIDKDEDKSIPVLYKTCHRFEALNETAWPEALPKSTKCRPGYYAQCHPCPLGYNKKSKRNKRCDVCGSGSGTPDEGAEWCTQLCKAGSRLLEDGKKRTRLCKPCDIGFYQPYPNVDYYCVPCPNNMVTAKTGSKSIKDCFLNCPPGQQPNSDSTECVLCPEGTYKSESGPNMCQTCSKNRSTAEDGAIDSNQCKKPCEPGREYNKTSGDCNIKCGRGTFKGEHSSRSKCRQCPQNFIPNARKAATACIPNCGPGYEINDNQDNCTACGFGFFKTETGNFPCQSCPSSQMTLAKAAKNSGECQDFHDCAKPLSHKLEVLFRELQSLVAEGESFIDLMVNTCRYGPKDIIVQLLEEVVNSFQTCGVLGQINLSDFEIGGKMYTKEHYLEIFRTAYENGGMCDFTSCLVETAPEIHLSKSWMSGNNQCPPTDAHCFCSDTYRALSTSFHHHLQLCPALQFHPEFLDINVGGKQMIQTLMAAPNIKTLCALPNSCDDIDCGHGTCSCSVSGGHQCRCRFGYTGEYCDIAQVPTEETEPDNVKDTKDENDAPASTTCPSCPDPPMQPNCPTCESCHECPEPPEIPVCTTVTPCPECPDQIPCPECPIPTNTPCPDCPACPEPQCPTNKPCPELPEPTKCPSTTSCPDCPIPICPTNAPCPDCPIHQCPTSAPCPDCPTPTCPTSEPCPTLAMPTSTPCPECPTCPTSAPCPSCPEPQTPPVCPTNPPCPECTTLSSSPIPTSTACPVCPEHTTAAPLTCAPCPDCPTTQKPTPCPTTTHCPACPTATEPPPCPTCMACPAPTPCPTVAESQRSCLELLREGNSQSGIYEIFVQSLGKKIEVYCDQESDGGGWIVLQRRQDGTVDFYRDWNAYKDGFGQLSREFWLGLDAIHHLTTSMSYDLRIDLQSFDYEKRFAKYHTIKIGSEGSNYILEADDYTGNAGDSFGKSSGRHNGQPFSTKDADNDAYSESCADLYKGGWWYDACHVSNLNGLYLNGDHDSYADGVDWYHWRGYHYSLKSTEMKIR